MTPEQQYKEATRDYVEALEEMAHQLSSTADRMRKHYAIDVPVKDRNAKRQEEARKIIDKYKQAGFLKDEPKAPILERQAPAKDWEILEYITTDKHVEPGVKIDTKDIEPGWRNHYDCACKTGEVAIHSVRRLSDNTVWTVGDKVAHVNCSDNNAISEIDRFEILGDGVNILAHFTSTSFFANRFLWQIRKINNKPLFTTADGVDIFDETEKVYNFYKHGVEQWGYFRAPKDSLLYSTREAAEVAYDAWLTEQPVLSMKDIGFYDLGETGWDNLKDIVKDKIAKR